jgi:hypothetical protein
MGSPLIKVPLTTLDSSSAHLDTDFLMKSSLMSSALTAPKSQAQAQLSSSSTSPSASGFCLTPKRGLGGRTQSQLRGLSRRKNSVTAVSRWILSMHGGYARYDDT